MEHLCGSRTNNGGHKGLRDGADTLDDQETSQFRSMVGTALHVGQDRPETQYATKEAARFMSGPTRAARCMLKRVCKSYSEAPVLRWTFPYQEMPSEIGAATDANWAGEPGKCCGRRRADGSSAGSAHCGTWIKNGR